MVRHVYFFSSSCYNTHCIVIILLNLIKIQAINTHKYFTFAPIIILSRAFFLNSKQMGSCIENIRIWKCELAYSSIFNYIYILLFQCWIILCFGARLFLWDTFIFLGARFYNEKDCFIFVSDSPIGSKLPIFSQLAILMSWMGNDSLV